MFDSSPDVVIIGAGLAGLVAASEIVGAGRRVVVLEKSRGVGGRMATRRVGDAVCDHGAQFFTVRGHEFGGMVAEAQAAEAVATWCDGFAKAAPGTASLKAVVDGHPRWRGVRGMTDLPKWLAAELPPEQCEVRTGVRVVSIGVADGRVRLVVKTAAAAESPLLIEAAAAIVTTPVPQSLDLMAAGGLLADSATTGSIDPEVRRQLATVGYDPCFALLLALNRPSLVPPPGGIQFAEGPISWLADNQQKGISAVPALTIHAAGDLSRQHFDDSPDDVAAMLIDCARPWIDGDPRTVVVSQSLHRWKYAAPTTIIPASFLVAITTPPIVCCGDAFGGPKVEGAAASGRAAGRWVVCLLG
ncbi:MAG: FAD-dependent oxidoreductase [Planctomycetota bacterium]